MPARTIKSKVLYRSFELDRASIDADKRTVELSFSSEMPAARWFGNEILDHSEGSVDLSRMNSGGALLVNHDPEQQVGVCEKAWLGSDKRCRGVFRFGSSARAQEIFTDVKDGIRRTVSVGYRINKMIRESEVDGVETFRATSWQVLEATLTPVPLDPSVGVGRMAGEENEIQILDTMKRNILLETAPSGGGGGAPAAPAAPAPVVIEVDPNDTRRDERLRMAEIRKISDAACIHHEHFATTIKRLRDKCEESGTSIEEFRKIIFDTVYVGAKPLPSVSLPVIGMSQKEIKEYSLTRAILTAARNGGRLDGIEGEAHAAMEREMMKENRMAAGFWVPMDVLGSKRLLNDQKRTLTTNAFTAGGAFVGEDLQEGSFIELLRNQMVVMAMGARSMTGLRGDVAIPRQSGGATAYWLPEGGTTTLSTQTIGQLALKPHRLSAATAYDKQLLIQSSVSVEDFVRSDLAAVLAIERDRACLNGLGAAGEPLGIINTTGLSTTTTITNSATITWVGALLFEKNIATNNAVAGNMGFVTSIATRAGTKATQKFSGAGDMPVWADGDTINGYRAMATNQMPSTCNALFGNWSDFIVADWAGLDVVVDGYTLVKQAQIQVVLNQWMDCGLRHPTSFTKAEV